MKKLIPLLLLVLLPACENKPTATTAKSIPRVWTSTGTDYAETDSLAACKSNGVLAVFATAKHGNRLDVFDAQTGRFIRKIGSEGKQPGQFLRPNGIIVVNTSKDNPRLFVIERDNARVQVIHPDTSKTVGMIGEGILTRPYGAAVSYDNNAITVYVTEEKIPDHKCIRMFQISEKDARCAGAYLRSFGDSDGPGAILLPESIVYDPVSHQLLICDEDRKQKNVKVYTADGRFTGTIFGSGYVKGDPEGIVVVDGADGGLVILTDQEKELTRWHLFSRDKFDYLGTALSEPPIANTDGICVFPDPIGPFKGGALFAVNDDADVAAYDLASMMTLFANGSAKTPSGS